MLPPITDGTLLFVFCPLPELNVLLAFVRADAEIKVESRKCEKNDKYRAYLYMYMSEKYGITSVLYAVCPAFSTAADIQYYTCRTIVSLSCVLFSGFQSTRLHYVHSWLQCLRCKRRGWSPLLHQTTISGHAEHSECFACQNTSERKC